MQHILAIFRTQRVEKIAFELRTADAAVTIALHCENGGQHWEAGLPVRQSLSSPLPPCMLLG